MDAIFRDSRHGIRVLLQNPAFTAVIVLTLALGIGANTAMFSVVNTVMLQPLPFRDSGRLVSIWTTSQGARGSTAFPDYREIREQNRSFESVAAYTRRPVNVTGKQDPERLRTLVVSPEFLSTLSVRPRLGRDFLRTEAEPGSEHVVIIADGIWRSSFGADPQIVGRNIRLDGEPYTIIGVLPPDFWFLDFTDQLIVPLSVAPRSDNRGNHFLNMIARLRPGVTHEAAVADLASISNAIAEKFSTNKDVGFGLAYLREEVMGNVRTAILVLMAAVGFVLLIACGNLASLLMARGVARQKETAIRMALGATRALLLRQFTTESALFALIGGAVGVLCAYVTTRMIRLASPSTLPRASQIHIDPAVLLFALGASVLTGIIFGIIPVAQATRVNTNDALKEGGHGSAGTTGQYRIRAGLVVGEVALALVLLAGAGLMIKSLHLLRSVDSGFDDSNVLIFNVNLPEGKYATPELMKNYPFPGATQKANLFLQQAVDRISQVQGVRAVGATSSLPLFGISWDKVATFYDRPLPSSVEKLPPIEYRPVAGDYFRAMGIRLISGRFIDAHDTQQSALVAVVSQELVRRYMNGENPVGKVLSVNPPIELLPPSAAQSDYPKEQQKFTIVGVVGNARYSSLQQEAGPMVYAPYSQNAEGTLSLWFAVHTDRDPLSVVGAVRRQMAELDQDLPLGRVTTMGQVVTDQIGRPRIEMYVLSAFGGLALLLAGVGVYGVMSYSIAERTREIGIRMALGARLMDVMHLVMRQGARLIVLGLILGFAGAVMLTKLMSSMLYGIGVTDPEVFVTTCALLVFTALMATYFPARRATRIDPQVTLRSE
jgi:putative ABC transport system permease protein